MFAIRNNEKRCHTERKIVVQRSYRSKQKINALNKQKPKTKIETKQNKDSKYALLSGTTQISGFSYVFFGFGLIL